MTEPRKPAILLLHGAWHGAWCWEAVARALISAGHVVSAIDLPGGGLRAVEPTAFATGDPAAMATERTALGDLSAAEYAETALSALSELAAAHGPVVVVGHSLSGVVLNHLGERAPEQIERLVYLAALAPAPGSTVFADAGGPAFADSLFLSLPASDPAATGVVRINWHSPDGDYRETGRQCFYGDVPDDLAAVATRMLTCDVPARLYSDDMVLTAERWGSLPRTWIRCTLDRAVPVAAQDLNIQTLDDAYPDHPFDVVTLETGHSPFLSAPEDLVRVLAAAASAPSD